MLKSIDFWPLVPKKLSVESSINDNVHQKSMFNLLIILSKITREKSGTYYILDIFDELSPNIIIFFKWLPFMIDCLL